MGAEPQFIPSIRSDLADDPALRGLIDAFISDLPARVHSLFAALHAQQFTELERLAHQLKGDGGGYGFSGLSARAADLEKVLTRKDLDFARSRMSELRSKIDDLAALCHRIRA
ncbi:hypothetical protein BH11PLA1_BH11PLA1_02780 [soil metagenome]